MVQNLIEDLSQTPKYNFIIKHSLSMRKKKDQQKN